MNGLTTARIDVRLLGRVDDYTASLPVVTMHVPVHFDNGAVELRSTAFALLKPQGEVPAAAMVSVYRADGTRCRLHHLLIQTPAQAAARSYSGDERELHDAIVAESNDPAAQVRLTHEPAPAYACAAPFAPARVDGEASPPAYPPIAVMEHASGLVLVKVTLTPGLQPSYAIYHSTNDLFNDSALSAAERTKYLPETIGCREVAGSYIFRAQYVSR